MKKNDLKFGFSLIEVLLVIGIVSIFSFIKMQEVQEDQLNLRAKTIAAQIQQVGQATNAYINLNYDKISAMNNIPSGKDGPLTCDKGKKTCTITIKTLKNDFLLPEQFTGVNLMKSGYDITLKVEGTSPNYQINGLVVTDKGLNLKQNKNAILLGKTIQYAGIDSGFSKTNNEISGLAGAWKESATKYNTIKQEGQLAYQVGYRSNMYSIYLRRDGTLPMTGDLNLDEHNIKNIANAYIHKDLFVDGKADVKGDIYSGKTINAKGEIRSDSWVRAKNGYGDTISIGGDSANNDYEIYLSAINKPISIHRAGNSSDIILRTTGGIETRGGGQIIASGNITSSLRVQGKTVESLDRMKVGEFLELVKSVKVGDSCSPNGLVARNQMGYLLSCINGKWISNADVALPVGAPIPWPSTVIPPNWFEANGQTFDKGKYPQLAIVYPSGKLPDLRGEFIRGWDHGRGVDEQPKRALLSSQLDQIQNITGQFPIELDENGTNVKGAFYYDGSQVRGRNAEPAGKIDELVKFDASRVARAGKETRGRNVTFMYIIRAQ